METKREKFVRLAENRTNNVLKGIELLGNLANHNNYDFSKDDLRKIVKSLKSSVNELERIYDNSANKNNKFKL